MFERCFRYAHLVGIEDRVAAERFADQCWVKVKIREIDVQRALALEARDLLLRMKVRQVGLFTEQSGRRLGAILQRYSTGWVLPKPAEDYGMQIGRFLLVSGQMLKATDEWTGWDDGFLGGTRPTDTLDGRRVPGKVPYARLNEPLRNSPCPVHGCVEPCDTWHYSGAEREKSLVQAVRYLEQDRLPRGPLSTWLA